LIWRDDARRSPAGHFASLLLVLLLGLLLDRLSIACKRSSSASRSLASELLLNARGRTRMLYAAAVTIRAALSP
jgi:hypothetical protein